jgi:hypothetical protein
VVVFVAHARDYRFSLYGSHVVDFGHVLGQLGLLLPKAELIRHALIPVRDPGNSLNDF